MKTVYPDYYDSFFCIADKCKHSCCIGWEIGIDDETLEMYKSAHGEFGKKLQDNINFENNTFRLTDRERCPFLNERGLCDIIRELGEDALCQICSDHPRFVNTFSDREEIGLGLCCEAVAELVLSRNEPARLVSCGDETLTEHEKDILDTRDALLTILADKSESLDARVEKILLCAHTRLPTKAMKEWHTVYTSLERLDISWDKHLNALTSPVTDEITENEVPFEQLLAYFIYRHVSPAENISDLKARTAFACLSYRIIRHIYERSENKSFTELCEIARLYSLEIEYSEENTEKMINICRS